MENCIFCKILEGEIPSTTVHEDKHVKVIQDIHPQAPVHFVVLTKKHIGCIAQANMADAAVLGHALIQAGKIGQEHCPEGFRLIVNNGENGGQTVQHLHIHIVGGKKLTETFG